MNGVVLQKGEKFYTYLKAVFSSIKNTQINYNWLITDYVCYPQTDSFSKLFSNIMYYDRYCWLSGEELTAMVEEEDFQWIWAVFSGFDKSVPLEKILKYELPYADGYAGFWKNPVTIQHPLADIEIVPWDSSLTLVISKDCNVVSDFRRAFPLSEDLAEHNAV